MHQDCAPQHHHDHAFGQDLPRCGEKRTRIVVVLTAVMMVGEIIAGIAFGSMALLADGLHMASHAVALGIAAFAYAYARRHAHDPRYSFGTGKVNALGGYTGAVLLAVFAIFMAWESIERFFQPIDIQFNNAIYVAILGLAVNAISAVILGGGHDHGHSHGHGHDHGDHDHAKGHVGDDHHAQDHNLRGAYLHVIADALTSLLAIVALLAGKYFSMNWMDPAMGIVGAILVARWSVGLLRQSGHTLLDRQADVATVERMRVAVEGDDGDRVTDLHLWSIGPGIRAAAFTVLSDAPLEPEAYRARIPEDLGVVHATVEIVPCRHDR